MAADNASKAQEPLAADSHSSSILGECSTWWGPNAACLACNALRRAGNWLKLKQVQGFFQRQAGTLSTGCPRQHQH
jgi:hypothetical protein